MSLALRLVIVGIVLAATFAGGLGVGIRWVKADWQAETLERERQQRNEERKQAERAAAAAAEFERLRRESEVRRAELSNQLRKALQRPISCPAGQTLGDLVVPADVIGGLRDAARDAGLPADTAEPRR
jgi:hypothetical protein